MVRHTASTQTVKSSPAAKVFHLVEDHDYLTLCAAEVGKDWIMTNASVHHIPIDDPALCKKCRAALTR